jgi:hypothetical protein
MTDQELRIIEDRARKALAGPWIVSPNSSGGWGVVKGLGVSSMAICTYHEGREAEAEFIAHARMDVVHLALEVRRLKNLLHLAENLARGELTQ